MAGRVLLLVATRKGAWLFHGDASRRNWRLDGPHFLGHIFNHVVLDPRDGRTLLAAAKTGHLGPTIFRSTDRGEASGDVRGLARPGGPVLRHHQRRALDERRRRAPLETHRRPPPRNLRRRGRRVRLSTNASLDPEPAPLLYTGGAHVQASGTTLAALLADLDRQYPGIRFRMVDEQDRIRRHVRVFVNGDQVFELSRALRPSDDVVIVQALTGG